MIGMNYKKLILCLSLLSVSLKGWSQTDAVKKTGGGDSILVNILLDQSKR